MTACHLRKVLVILLLFSSQLYAQNKSVSLRDALKKVTKAFGTQFVFEKEVIEGKTTTYDVNNLSGKSSEEVLKGILYPNNLVFLYVRPNYYTIVVKDRVGGNKSSQSENAAKSDEVPVSVRSAAQIRVTGVVTDTTGKGVAGVTVTEQGTKNSTITNIAGEFAILVASQKSILVISSVGFATRQIPVGDQNHFNIALQIADSKLEEVVVVGYGTQRQKDVTGSVASLSAKDFNQGPILSPQQAMQGKIAGVNISQNSGKPGASNTVRVRGGTSLTGTNDPLYVIDGVPISTTAGVGQANIRGNGTDVFDQEPTNPLMTLNPNDIESISVLKDASAAAIYGSRGANGVIVITTKKGVAGKARVSFGATTGVSKVANTLPVLSADQYRKVVRDLGLTLNDKGANTDWQDEIYRNAIAQDYYLSLFGGSEKTTYRASLGWGDQEGIMLGSDLKRANARININHSALKDRLTFDMRVNYGQTTSNNAPVSNTVGSEAGTSMNYESYVFNPTYPVYENGKYTHVLPYRVNPVSFSTDVLDEKINNRFIGNLSTTLKILKPLSVNVNVGYTNQRTNRNSFIKQSNPLGEGLGGYASVQKLEDYSKLLETVMRFNERFGNHSLDAIAGYSYQYFVEEGDRSTANGFISDEFKWYSLQAASSITGVTTFKGSNTLISMYGRANYNFDDRILVTATVRRDGSSRFGEGNKWGVFPSGSVAWRLSREKFFTPQFISDLKVRASYGVTGNQEIGNLNSIQTLGASTTGYLVGGQRITTVLPQQYANPDLKWEQTSQFNAGIDYAVLKGRIHGSIDYYIKRTKDLLLRVPVPAPTAVATQLANVGSVENKGIELEIGANIIDKSDFQWSADLNFSRNKNKVLSLANDKYQGRDIQVAPLQGQGLTAGIYAQLITPGLPVGTFYGKQFYGIKSGVEQLGTKDTILGSAQPDFTFGLNNTFNYKAWSLSFNFRGSVGNEVFNLTANNLAYLSNLPGRNVFVEAVESGVTRDQPKRYSSRWIEDGSYVRLDNLTLGYNIPVGNTFLSNARVFLTGQNLLLITGYTGLDPEVNSEISGTGMAPLGVDYLSYPRAKTVSLGVNLTF